MSIPRPLQREYSVVGLSSNMKMIDFWPRLAAATQNCAAIVDFPVPAPPTINVLVPSSMPPPSKLSSSATVDDSLSPQRICRCSAAIRRGKTTRPPGLIK
jgi:hypothetical protein